MALRLPKQNKAVSVTANRMLAQVLTSLKQWQVGYGIIALRKHNCNGLFMTSKITS